MNCTKIAVQQGCCCTFLIQAKFTGSSFCFPEIHGKSIAQIIWPMKNLSIIWSDNLVNDDDI